LDNTKNNFLSIDGGDLPAWGGAESTRGRVGVKKTAVAGLNCSNFFDRQNITQSPLAGPSAIPGIKVIT